MKIRRVAICWVALHLFGSAAQAQDTVADFYKGKQIRIIVPSASGGGFDLYARYVGRHLGRHVPGKPTNVIRTMP
jgi:tripartite-type tricarboxylate transporter receptor subunit TctC